MVRDKISKGKKMGLVALLILMVSFAGAFAFAQEEVDEGSHGSINLRYRADLNVLEVWGESPVGAEGAVLEISSVSNYSNVIYTDAAPILNDNNNSNRYAFNLAQGNEIDVSVFENDSYNVEVTFTGLPGSYKVSDLFNDLELEGVQADLVVLYNEVEDLLIVVDNNTQEIEYLWNDSEQQWQAIEELNVDVNNLYFENDMQWVAICMLERENDMQWVSIFYLYKIAQYHEYEINMLFDLLEDHNHATINLDYRDADSEFFPNTLGVWGEAPLGAEYARIRIHYENMSVFESQIVAVDTKYENENGYVYHFNITDWPAEKYNVRVNFFNSDEEELLGYDVGDTFDGLVIDELASDVTILYNENDDQWIAILENEGNISLLWNEVEGIWEEIDDINTLNARQTNFMLMSREMINELNDVLVMHNHATISIDYRDVDADYMPNTLGVWGEAPIGADNARVLVYYQNATIFTEQTVPVKPTQMNENGYVYHFNVSGWESLIYNVRVNFYYDNGTYMNGYDVGDTFDGLVLDQLEEDVEILYNENDDQWIAILENEDNLTLLWNEIDGIWEEIDEINTDNMQQWSVLLVQQEMILELFDLLETHNHATINLDYRDAGSEFFPNTLGVWGEAPLGSEYARIRIHYENMSVFESQIVAVDTKYENENGYVYHFNVTDWPAEKYNVRVNFFNSDEEELLGYDVGAIFDGLVIDELVSDVEFLYNENEDQWVAILENEDNITLLWDEFDGFWEVVDNISFENAQQWIVIENISDTLVEQQDMIDALFAFLNAHNHATVNIDFRDGNADYMPNTLGVWGEAPILADTARILVYRQDMSIYKEQNVTVSATQQNLNGYVYHFNLTGWPTQIYNVRVNFYSEGVYMNGYDVGTIFSELTGFGIEDVLASSRVETYYNPHVGTPVTYTVQVNDDIANAVIKVRSTNQSDVFVNQTIREQTIFASQKYVFSDMIEFSELGYYDLEIYIEGYGWVSDSFNVEVVNLPDEVPQSDAFITSPVAQEDNVYWHSWVEDSTIDFDLTLLEGTPANWCEWVILRDGQNPEDGFLQLSTVENATLCSGTIYADEDFAEEGLYDLIGRAQFEGGFYLEDEISLGIDNSVPEIYEVTPDLGAFSGMIVINVNATDNLSGVDMVWVTMTPKNDSEGENFTVEAFYNESTGYYQGVFDTVAMNMSDASYDITATVYDLAGNMAEMTVDPIVDNTAPGITIVNSYFKTYDGKDAVDIYIKAKVADNLAGVSSAWVEFEGFECSLVAASNGVFVSDDSCIAPFNKSDEMSLVGTVYATDKAVPSNIGSLDVNIADIVDATPKDSSSSSRRRSSGGGGGSGFKTLVISDDNDEVQKDSAETSSLDDKTPVTEEDNTVSEEKATSRDVTSDFDEVSGVDVAASDDSSASLSSDVIANEDDSVEHSVGLTGLITGNIPTFAGLLTSIVVLGSVLVFGLRK